MFAHFRPLVVGERATELGREGPQFTREGLPPRGRVRGLQGDQHGQPGGPLHQRAARGRIGRAHEQVARPMSRHRAIRHRVRPRVNADQSLTRPRRQADFVRPTKAMAATEIPGEFPLQGAAGQHLQIGRDGFLRDAQRRVIRIPLRPAVRNLFRGPAGREPVQDGGAQARVDDERPRLARWVSPVLRPLVGRHRAIGGRRGPMACAFTRQRARGSLYRVRHRSETMACRQQATQFFPLHEVQSWILCPVQLLRSWNDQDTGVALGS
jgi:hypothetical protein